MYKTIAVLLFFVAVSAYVICFLIIGGDSQNYWFRLFEFMAPVCGGGLTLLGVSLTLNQQEKNQREVFRHQQLLAAKDRRLSVQPLVVCDVAQISREDMPASYPHINCRIEEDMLYMELRLTISGERVAQKIRLILIDEGSAEENIVLEKAVLEKGDPSLTRYYGVPADPKGKHPYSVFFVLQFYDISRNCYQRLYVLNVGSGREVFEGRLIREYSILNFTDVGNIRYVGNGRFSDDDSEESYIDTVKDYIKAQELPRGREDRAKSELQKVIDQLDAPNDLDDRILNYAGKGAGRLMRRLFELPREDGLLPAGAGPEVAEGYRLSRRGKYLFAHGVYSMGFSVDDGFSSLCYEWSYLVGYEITTGSCKLVSKGRFKNGVDSRLSKKLLIKMVFWLTPPHPQSLLLRFSYLLSKKIDTAG